MLGGETLLVDDLDDDVRLIKLARIGSWLVMVERPGDRARSKPHRFTAYGIDAAETDELFKLDPGCVLFVLHDTHFARPADYNLQLVQDPREWFNEVMAAIQVALEPVAPRPN
jgi:hypothetical protein